MSLRRALWLPAPVLALVLVATYITGELGEVALLRTFDETGVPYDTKLWIVDLEGVAWVRVARPGRAWLRRLERDPRALLVRGGETLPVLARPVPAPEVRAAVDAAFRSKYGGVDWWYGVVLRRDPLPIRLGARTF